MIARPSLAAATRLTLTGSPAVSPTTAASLPKVTCSLNTIAIDVGDTDSADSAAGVVNSSVGCAEARPGAASSSAAAATATTHTRAQRTARGRADGGVRAKVVHSTMSKRAMSCLSHSAVVLPVDSSRMPKVAGATNPPRMPMELTSAMAGAETLASR